MHKNKRWLMWALLLPTYFISFFHRTSLSPIGTLVLKNLNITENAATILGILTSVYFFTYSLMQFPVGFLADTIGPKLIVGFGGIIMGVGTILFAFSNSLYLSFFARFLIGFGASFNFLCLLKIQSNWFDKKEFPLLTGLTIFIGNLGALFGLGPFSIFIDWFGLQLNFIILASVSIISGIIILIFVDNYPDDVVIKNNSSSFLTTFKEVLKIKNNYYTLFAFGLTNGAYITFVSFCNIPFLMDVYNLSKNDASTLTTFVTLGVVIGCLFNSTIVKIFKVPKRAGIFSLTVALIFWLFISIFKINNKYIWTYSIIYFIFGFFLAGLNLTFTNVKFNNPIRIEASALSFTNFGSFISIAIFQFLSGLVLDLFAIKETLSSKIIYPEYGYRVLFFGLSTIHLLGIIAYIFTKKEVDFQSS